MEPKPKPQSRMHTTTDISRKKRQVFPAYRDIITIEAVNLPLCGSRYIVDEEPLDERLLQDLFLDPRGVAQALKGLCINGWFAAGSPAREYPYLKSFPALPWVDGDGGTTDSDSSSVAEENVTRQAESATSGGRPPPNQLEDLSSESESGASLADSDSALVKDDEKKASHGHRPKWGRRLPDFEC